MSVGRSTEETSKDLRAILAFFCSFSGQVAHPDGDFRLTIVNSSVLDRPRALVLMPQEG